jgi:hypothetical protein
VSAKEFAELYVNHVFCLHGLSREFITDHDPRFTSAFWQEVTILLGTRTVMSSSFHQQTDGQTERVNRTLETYLRHFIYVGMRLKLWRIIGNGKLKSRQGLERFCMLSKLSEQYRCFCAPHDPSE